MLPQENFENLDVNILKFYDDANEYRFDYKLNLYISQGFMA